MNTDNRSPKWVMAATLLAILGTNVSVNSPKPEAKTIEFASTHEEKTSKVYTAEGVVPVTYMIGGGNEVLATIPKRNTEGKICGDCGSETIPFTSKNSGDIDTLNVELMKILDTTLKTEAEALRKKVASEQSQITVDENEEEVEKPNPFEKITARCERRKERMDQLSCMKDEFLKLVKTKNAKNLDQDQALEFFKSEIEKRLVSELTDARRIAARARRASVDQNTFLTFSASEEGYKDPNEMVNESLRVIEDLLAKTPQRFESIRRHLLTAETAILKYQAAEVKQVQSLAQANSGTAEGLYLTQESNILMGQLESMRQNMGERTFNALSDAGAAGHISFELESQYKKIYQNFNTDLIKAMTQQSDFLNSVLSQGTLTSVGVDLSARIIPHGRGGSATATGTTTPGQRVVTPVQGTNFNAVTDIASGTTVLVPNNNVGVNFNPAVTATTNPAITNPGALPNLSNRVLAQ